MNQHEKIAQDAGTARPAPRKRRGDTKVKLGFLLVAVAVAMAVYYLVQTRRPMLPGTWSHDLPAALKRAKAE
ncbi:MAG: hypothetical protein J7M21_06500, partial [Planctomycetes bacterium]|nr:hypothetical protein [Planctomycetota bacterium]